MVLLEHSVKDVVFYATGALINAFNEEDIRFVFNLEGLNPDIKVEVYDKTMKDDSRKKLYESSAKHFQYEPSIADGLNRLYINYIVPPVEAKDEIMEKGCVILTTGYRNV